MSRKKLARQATILDCTLRDGGYYNKWNFSQEVIEDYLLAMKSAQIDVVEVGFRFYQNIGFKGACAYTTDEFLNNLNIPTGLKISVMVNGSDLCKDPGCEHVIHELFPNSAKDSPVSLVRIACHYTDLHTALPAAGWLHQNGYKVGFNLMQVADRSQDEIDELIKMVNDWPINVLYFADSMGSMTPDDTQRMVHWLKKGWKGPIGIHTHDNMGMGLANTLRAYTEGVDWLDSTVTGMGRGPGNTKTEELIIETESIRNRNVNIVPLMRLIHQIFEPMKEKYKWGTNPYYYMTGKYGIHPSFVQEMIGDTRYDEEDIIAVIDYLRTEGGKHFSFDSLDSAREFYRGVPKGSWNPIEKILNREVLILGSGPNIVLHINALEAYIRRKQPLVLALNTQSKIDQSLIDLRIACHPVRLLADAESYKNLPQPLITPYSMLPEQLQNELNGVNILDFGLTIKSNLFDFLDTYCIVPTSLVLAYTLAVVTSGKASNILMAGFDGYPPGDPRNDEVESILKNFSESKSTLSLTSITYTQFKNISSKSLYAL